MAGETTALMGSATAPVPASTPAPGDDTALLEEDDADPVDDSQPRVLCTIMDNRDGTFTLTKGDEGEAGGEDALSGEASEGMPPAAGGVAAQPKGESFDAPGPLLKAVLDILKDAEEQAGGSADANFNAGFEGPKEPAAKSY